MNSIRKYLKTIAVPPSCSALTHLPGVPVQCIWKVCYLITLLVLLEEKVRKLSPHWNLVCGKSWICVPGPWTFKLVSKINHLFCSFEVRDVSFPDKEEWREGRSSKLTKKTGREGECPQITAEQGEWPCVFLLTASCPADTCLEASRELMEGFQTVLPSGNQTDFSRLVRLD